MKTNKITRLRIARLDRYVFVVALLWLAATLALVFTYQQASAQAAHSHTTRPESVAVFVSQIASRANSL